MEIVGLKVEHSFRLLAFLDMNYDDYSTKIKENALQKYFARNYQKNSIFLLKITLKERNKQKNKQRNI